MYWSLPSYRHAQRKNQRLTPWIDIVRQTPVQIQIREGFSASGLRQLSMFVNTL